MVVETRGGTHVSLGSIAGEPASPQRLCWAPVAGFQAVLCSCGWLSGCAVLLWLWLVIRLCCAPVIGYQAVLCSWGWLPDCAVFLRLVAKVCCASVIGYQAVHCAPLVVIGYQAVLCSCGCDWLPGCAVLLWLVTRLCCAAVIGCQASWGRDKKGLELFSAHFPRPSPPCWHFICIMTDSWQGNERENTHRTEPRKGDRKRSKRDCRLSRVDSVDESNSGLT